MLAAAIAGARIEKSARTLKRLAALQASANRKRAKHNRKLMKVSGARFCRRYMRIACSREPPPPNCKVATARERQMRACWQEHMFGSKSAHILLPLDRGKLTCVLKLIIWISKLMFMRARFCSCSTCAYKQPLQCARALSSLRLESADASDCSLLLGQLQSARPISAGGVGARWPVRSSEGAQLSSLRSADRRDDASARIQESK